MAKEDSIIMDKEKVQHEYDIYKDSPVRLLGILIKNVNEFHFKLNYSLF